MAVVSKTYSVHLLLAVSISFCFAILTKTISDSDYERHYHSNMLHNCDYALGLAPHMATPSSEGCGMARGRCGSTTCIYSSYGCGNVYCLSLISTLASTSLVPRPHPLFNVTRRNIEKWVWPGDEATLALQ